MNEPPVLVQVALLAALGGSALWQMLDFAFSELRTGRGSVGDWVFPGILTCLLLTSPWLAGWL